MNFGSFGKYSIKVKIVSNKVRILCRESNNIYK